MEEAEQVFSQELCNTLHVQGLVVAVRTEIDGGERDTRLHATLPSAPSAVELLGPLNDLPLSPRWQAVRVESGRRSVWEGPGRRGSRSQLRAFVWDVACLEPERLRHRWPRLG